jgi:hypothetical protein
MGNFTSEFVAVYDSFISILPSPFQNFINLFLLVLLIFIYSLFIWKFYKFIAEKNIFGLDLNRYNKSEHPLITKLIAGGLYLVEYIIILPFLIFFWFTIFTFFLILLIEKGIEVGTILLISAVVIAAIRMAAYYQKGLAEDIAKILPFTLLAIFVLNPQFFTIGFLTRIISSIGEIPSFFSEIIGYLVFIIVLEIILRLFEFLFSLFGIDEEETKPKEEA